LQLEYQNILNLTEYYKLILAEIWKFPDFSDKCPICGAKNCAVRIGYYNRCVYIFKLKIKLYMPVARYLCRRKNKTKSQWKSTHKTFSLLPSQLIPYRMYDLDSMLYIADLSLKKNISFLDVSINISTMKEHSEISISTATIMEYRAIFIQGCTKLKTLCEIVYDTYERYIDYLKDYTGGIIKFVENIYLKHVIFTFGTPSQIRIKTF
jgi:hypothetical protein